MFLVEGAVHSHRAVVQLVDLPHQSNNAGGSEASSPRGHGITHPAHRLTVRVRRRKTKLLFEDLLTVSSITGGIYI